MWRPSTSKSAPTTRAYKNGGILSDPAVRISDCRGCETAYLAGLADLRSLPPNSRRHPDLISPFSHTTSSEAATKMEE